VAELSLHTTHRTFHDGATRPHALPSRPVGLPTDEHALPETALPEIALEPDEPGAYYNLGVVLSKTRGTRRGGRAAVPRGQGAISGQFPVGSEPWAKATATAFDMLTKEECVRRGGQAGVVERRGAQGAVGEGGAGGAERRASDRHAGSCAERFFIWLLGGGPPCSLGSGWSSGWRPRTRVGMKGFCHMAAM
jgi:hypothetical protein